MSAHSVSLEQAREAQDDGGGEDPAYDDSDDTPNLPRTVCEPGITHVEAHDGKEEFQRIEERLERRLDTGLVPRVRSLR